MGRSKDCGETCESMDEFEETTAADYDKVIDKMAADLSHKK